MGRWFFYWIFRVSFAFLLRGPNFQIEELIWACWFPLPLAPFCGTLVICWRIVAFNMQLRLMWGVWTVGLGDGASELAVEEEVFWEKSWRDRKLWISLFSLWKALWWSGHILYCWLLQRISFLDICIWMLRNDWEMEFKVH